ncbi:unnamed protein product [Rhizophagus irregularis]|nr:unnamed protein product [Rhizophagus irregularis]
MHYQYQLFGFSWYRRPSLWIGIGTFHFGLVSIGTRHFGLISAPFTLDWYRRLSLWIGQYRRPSLWIGIGKTLHIGETLHFGSVSLYRRNPSLWIWYRLQPLDTSIGLRYSRRFVGSISKVQDAKSTCLGFNFEGPGCRRTLISKVSGSPEFS